ncbi:hypothetical protein QNH26_11190 [Peribacillus frigoritolerans]|nr:hypothetical protein [Peribacillus frigoritolerans]WHX69088.1 hypothetical protein QNH26_11190 [Peribacillus frigoritolerans]
MSLFKELYAFMENEKLRKSMVMIVFTPFNEIWIYDLVHLTVV